MLKNIITNPVFQLVGFTLFLIVLVALFSTI